MTTHLIKEKIAQQVLPLSWKLSGSDGDLKSLDIDGYKIQASMGWVKVDVDSEQGDITGTMGTCVEGLNEDYLTVADGNPTVCHFIDATGNDVNNLALVTIDYDSWSEGNWSMYPDNKGTPIPEIYKPSTDGSALGFATGVADSVSTTEEAEEAVEDADEEWGDNEESNDNAFQDDEWEDNEEEFDGAVEDANEAIERAESNTRPEKKKSWGDQIVGLVTNLAKQGLNELSEEGLEYVTGKLSAKYEWYQPKAATSYQGLRRYNIGDKVQVYAVPMQSDPTAVFALNPQGNVQTLLDSGAALAAGLAFCATQSLLF